MSIPMGPAMLRQLYFAIYSSGVRAGCGERGGGREHWHQREWRNAKCISAARYRRQCDRLHEEGPIDPAHEQRRARRDIPAPATGLLVYETTTNGSWYFNGTICIQLLNSGNAGWSTTGNAGTVAGTNFLGTTDAVPLEIRVAGVRSGYLSPAATTNTSWGFQALPTSSGTENMAMGYQVLQMSTTGSYNTASGHQALRSNTTGSVNTANGYQALFNNTVGFNNTATGSGALYSNSSGSNNTARRRLVAAQREHQRHGEHRDGSFLAAVPTPLARGTRHFGVNALRSNTSGNDNTAA